MYKIYSLISFIVFTIMLFSDVDLKLSIYIGFIVMVNLIGAVVSKTEDKIIKEIKSLKNRD